MSPTITSIAELLPATRALDLPGAHPCEIPSHSDHPPKFQVPLALGSQASFKFLGPLFTISHSWWPRVVTAFSSAIHTYYQVFGQGGSWGLGMTFVLFSSDPGSSLHPLEALSPVNVALPCPAHRVSGWPPPGTIGES